VGHRRTDREADREEEKETYMPRPVQTPPAVVVEEVT
jgi:hypothetical protein